ncbi:MAG: hypothetical protein NVSMB65_02160 [Chloroflexota bacterium]
MFCQHCGARVTVPTQQYCDECGRETGPQRDEGLRQGVQGTTAQSWSVPHIQHLIMPAPRVIVRYGMARPLVAVLIGLLLLPLILPLMFGSLLLGVVLLGILAHMVPVLAVGAGITWLVMRQRRARRTW